MNEKLHHKNFSSKSDHCHLQKPSKSPEIGCGPFLCGSWEEARGKTQRVQQPLCWKGSKQAWSLMGLKLLPSQSR